MWFLFCFQHLQKTFLIMLNWESTQFISLESINQNSGQTFNILNIQEFCVWVEKVNTMDWVNLWNKPGGEALSIIEREVCILPFSASPNYCQLGCKGNHPLKNNFEKLFQSSTEGESSCWGFLAGGTFFSERLVFSSRLSENKNLNFQLEKENNIGLALIKTKIRFRASPKFQKSPRLMEKYHQITICALKTSHLQARHKKWSRPATAHKGAEEIGVRAKIGENANFFGFQRSMLIQLIHFCVSKFQ